MQTNTVEEIIADLEAGKMVVIMDDEDRENEGDLLMAAECVRPEDINFMARYGRGLICLTLTRDRCEQLKLPLMVTDNNEKHSTNFTVSIEAADGVTTGISAADRAVTVQAAVKQGAQPADIVQPGHIFPLMARSGGVLERTGHTEASVDLARLAGSSPAGVICEIMKDDGEMARLPDLVDFAKEHKLKITTIEKLVALAILMPVVASMGGIAGTQTLTIVVRGLALGQVGSANARSLMLKELGVAALNSTVWAGVVGLVAALWFTDQLPALRCFDYYLFLYKS